MKNIKVNMNNRKEQYRKSQKKVRDIMKKQGKIAISDYILEETKNKLVEIKNKNGFRRIGDAIDEVVKDK